MTFGDLVLGADYGIPEVSWPLSRNVTIFSGSDNVLRSVEVKTTFALLRCPETKLLDLLAEHGGTDVTAGSVSFQRLLNRAPKGKMTDVSTCFCSSLVFLLLVSYMQKFIWKLLQTELFLFLILVIFGFGNIYIILSYPGIIISWPK